MNEHTNYFYLPNDLNDVYFDLVHESTGFQDGTHSRLFGDAAHIKT